MQADKRTETPAVGFEMHTETRRGGGRKGIVSFVVVWGR